MMLPDSWKLPIEAVSGLMLALLVGYAFGRYATPPKIQTHETVRTETKVVDDTVSKTRVTELTTELDTLKRARHVVRTVVIKPDGTHTSQTVIDSTSVDIKEAQQSIASEVDTHAKVSVASQTTAVVTQTVSSEKPNWRLGPMVGAGNAGVSYGVLVERRILGPISIGGWFLSNPSRTSIQGGATITLEF